MAASEAYDLGKYDDCLQLLQETRDLLGKDQPAICYLSAKARFKVKDYLHCRDDIKKYFALHPAENSFQYKEIINLVSDLEPILTAEKKLFDKIKSSGTIEDINNYSNRYPLGYYDEYEEILVLEVQIYLRNGDLENAKRLTALYSETVQEGKLSGKYIGEIREAEKNIESRYFRNVVEQFFHTNFSKAKDASMKYFRLYPEGDYLNEIRKYIHKLNHIYLRDERDGKGYPVKLYGDKLWMTQNLDYDVPEESWKYDYYQLAGVNYGRLYTWEKAAEVCPEGWHLPDQDEWRDILSDQMGGFEQAFWSARYSEGFFGIVSGKRNGTNSSGFSLLPTGYYNTRNHKFQDSNVFVYEWINHKNPKNNKPYAITDPGKKLIGYPVKPHYACAVRCVNDEVTVPDDTAALVFREEFDNNDYGWEPDSNLDGIEYHFNDGKYTIHTRTHIYSCKDVYLNAERDYSMEASLTLAMDLTNKFSYYGIVWGADIYIMKVNSFKINADGYFVFSHGDTIVAQGQKPELIKGSIGATNKLTVTKKDDQLALYINGVRIYTGNNVNLYGLNAGFDIDHDLEISCDYFKVVTH